jgi:hypothetical protein
MIEFWMRRLFLSFISCQLSMWTTVNPRLRLIEVDWGWLRLIEVDWGWLWRVTNRKWWTEFRSRVYRAYMMYGVCT